jgi:hypothetical protein
MKQADTPLVRQSNTAKHVPATCSKTLAARPGPPAGQPLPREKHSQACERRPAPCSKTDTRPGPPAGQPKGHRQASVRANAGLVTRYVTRALSAQHACCAAPSSTWRQVPERQDDGEAADEQLRLLAVVRRKELLDLLGVCGVCGVCEELLDLLGVCGMWRVWRV